MEIVSKLRTALTRKVGRERFDLWLGACRFELGPRTLRVAVPSALFLDWIRVHFRPAMEAACVEVIGKPLVVSLYVDAALDGPRDDGSSDGGSSVSDGCAEEVPTPIEDGTIRSATGVASYSREGSPGGAGNASAGRSPRGGVPARRKFASLATFVSGRTNALALAAAESVARRPGEMTPLVIHGPTSVGKTHLLEGIWTAARRASREPSAIYLSAEEFTTHFLAALRGGGLPNFRRKCRGVGVLIVDDVQFFEGKRATQVELFQTIDALLRAGRQLVFAADRPPAELTDLLPELVTRLEGGMVCRVEPPDYATRLGIVGRMAAARRLDVPADVQRLIASRLTHHARELSGALCRVQATSEATGRPITPALAEEALAEMISQSSRVVRLPDVERAVCAVFGLEPASLHSSRKVARVSHPRMLAMWLARKHTRAALSEIGDFFGRRSHSTVISAQKRVDGWMAAGEPLVLAERVWDVEEAVRQVERRLLAG